MPNQNLKTIRWRRFSRTPFASFQSMHREFNIGVLAVAMLSAVVQKSRAEGVVAVGCARDVAYEEDSILNSQLTNLDEVIVLASRVPLSGMQAPRLVTVLSAAEIAASPAQSINDLLKYTAGVDVRQRGEFGVQTDISVRGGTFDQITLLLNGINISSPQTGHHSADFPVSVQDIERIEILEGPCARVFGTSAFTGVINIVTRKEKRGGEVRLNGGDYGYAGAEFRVHSAQCIVHSSLSGGYNRSDGATHNSDFSVARGFYQGGFSKDDLDVNLQLGYSYKQYGANTFYGAASTDQWESNEHYISSLSFNDKFFNVLHVSASANWNRWYDHYQWHKNNPAGENFHRVDALGFTANAWFDSKFGRTSFGAESRYEGIYSTKLGEPLAENKWKPTQGHDAVSDIRYSHQADRMNYSFFAEHNLLLQDFTISLGVLANRNTALDHKWRLYPGVDLCYNLSDDWRLFASWNMALRMPTFTDLYYSGTNIVGTKDIMPEKTNDVSLGAKFRQKGWKAELNTFYSHKQDMIDWVIYADEPDKSTFRSGNFMLDNIGGEIAVTFLPQELWQNTYLRRLGVQYAYIDENIKYSKEILASKYAMEYLRHKVVLQSETSLWKNTSLSLSWSWQGREGMYNKPYSLLDLRFAWNLRNMCVSVDCNNVLNKQYFDYSYIPQPGRWTKIGISYRF